MIEAIEIENFRCFKERQRVEFAPITLSYGANNSGKSSATYALLLFHQWLDAMDGQIGKLRLTNERVDVGPCYQAGFNGDTVLPIKIKVEYQSPITHCRRSIELGVESFVTKDSPATPRKSNDHARIISTIFESGDDFCSDSRNDSRSCEIRQELLDLLAKTRCIGPVRSSPTGYEAARRPNEVAVEDWYNGLAAWDYIGYAGEDQLIWTNQWLGPDYLDTGVAICTQKYCDSVRFEQLVNEELSDRNSVTKTDLIHLAMKLFGTSDTWIRFQPLQGDEIAGIDSLLLRPDQIGMGICQILPVVIACMSRLGWLFVIQEPESHVHPRLQSRLGDLLIDSTAHHLAYGSPNQLLVESHSEHLLLRLKRRIKETTKGTAKENLEINSEQVCINYFRQEDGATTVRQIHLDENGDFIEPWPDDFFELGFFERFPDAR